MQKASRSSGAFRVSRLLVAASGLAIACQAALAGTWTKIVTNPPSAIQLMLLLTDGTVMCSQQNGSTIGSAWYRLTPNAAGSYVNGTWTTLTAAPHSRLYYPSQVLKDGRVFVAGGEYGTGGGFAEVYDPATNAWTNVTPGGSLWNSGSDNFYDCNSEILNNGKVLIMPVFPHVSAQSLLYDPATNTWANTTGKLFRGTYQDEATWVKLPDDTILTIDPFGTFSERYNPPTNTWINDGVVPVSLYDPFGFELGGGEMLPNGKAFFLGSTGNTAHYTPTGTTAPGTWTAGPVIPGSHGTPDAPCAMMIDGKILCAVSAVPTSGNHFPSPTSFYEYDWSTNSFASISGPTGATDPISSYQAAMLALPNGQIMYSHMNTSVYVYTPGGAAIAFGKPSITALSDLGGGTYHLTGVQINGVSEGASYGDDLQMNSNYPIVRLNHSNGNVYYAKTTNFSHFSVKPGLAESCDYKLPTGFPAGSYSLTVVANGNPSDAATAPGLHGPDDVVVCPDGTGQFHVAVSSKAPVTYQWRRGASNLTNTGHFSGVTTSTLTVSNVTPAEAGTNYNCVVTSFLGSTTSANATLTYCPADFDCSGFVDAEDYNSFVAAFEAGTDNADVDGSGFVDIEDFVYFVQLFELGC